MCKETKESVCHILNMCRELSSDNYLKRQDNVAAIEHNDISIKFISDQDVNKINNNQSLT